MGGKKKKRITTNVRVNTVTKEVKVEEKPETFQTVTDLSPGYIKLFSKNPNYNVIIKHSKTKKTLSVPHKTMVQIIRMQERSISQLPNFIQLHIDSNKKMVDKFKSLDDLKMDQKYVNLFKYVVMYSFILRNKASIDLSKFSVLTILKMLKKDIYGITNYLTINIIQVAYTELIQQRRTGFTARAHSKELSYEIMENERSSIMMFRASTDNADRFKKLNINETDLHCDIAGELLEGMIKKRNKKKEEMLDYISDPKCFYIKVKDTYVLKSDIDKAIKDKKEKVIKVKAIDGNEILIKVNEVNKLSSPNNIYVRIKDNKENKDYFVNQSAIEKIYKKWITYEKIYKIKNDQDNSEIQFKAYSMSPYGAIKEEGEEDKKEIVVDVANKEEIKTMRYKSKQNRKGKVNKANKEPKRVYKIQRAIYKLTPIE